MPEVFEARSMPEAFEALYVPEAFEALRLRRVKWFKTSTRRLLCA